ncbi:hypothetical protein Nmel_006388 [Mimus melanotis]
MGDGALRFNLARLPAVPTVPGPLSREVGREPRAPHRPGPGGGGVPRQVGGAGLPVPRRCGPRNRKNIPPAPAPSPHDGGQAGGNQIPRTYARPSQGRGHRCPRYPPRRPGDRMERSDPPGRWWGGAGRPGGLRGGRAGGSGFSAETRPGPGRGARAGAPPARPRPLRTHEPAL